MTKVGTTSRAKATARFSRSSLCYTGLFFFKLACTPLFAYLTEPMPWSLPERHVQVWDSFDVFNNATFEYLREHLNGQTMSNSSDLHFDSSTNTYAMRRRLEFPLEAVPTALQSSYLIRFQAAMFFGHGMQVFVNDFLSQDASARRKSRLHRCQRGYYFGAVSNDACLWLEPVLNGTASDEYEVYYGPLISLTANTPMMKTYSIMWTWLLPSALEFQGIEGATGVITGMLPTGFFPVYLSFALQKLHSSRQRTARLESGMTTQW
ncbi:hypothetical protein Ae201684P_020353 [Aphanomyces euteiches]|nr:hypothetical protein Ae201684P_020353 [Aphanomyces euteiches]